MTHLYELVNNTVTGILAPYGNAGEVRTQRAQPGYDRQIVSVMALAKQQGISPKDLAEKIAGSLASNPLFSSTAVSGPGFINLTIADDAIIAGAQKATGSLAGETKKMFLIDFGGPNVAKALHVGHLRSLVIGESLRRILKARGHKVISDIHFGDWGLPMGMLIDRLTWGANGRVGLTSKNAPNDLAQLLERIYPDVVAECKANENRMASAQAMMVALQEGDRMAHEAWIAIRQASLNAVLPQIERLGAHFDLLNGESNSATEIANIEALLQGHIEHDDGAYIIPVARADDKKPLPPLIFRKSDGGYTYAATDLMTIVQRGRYNYDHLLYVVDNRQADHFKQVFRAASHFYSGKMTHIGFGTVNGVDGKPFKTRDGDVPTLKWMLDEAVAKASERTVDPQRAEKIGLAAVKFADLITTRHSGYVFDLDRIVNPEGKTGPYLQYACVRIGQIVKKVPPKRNAVIQITHPAERDLLLACAYFPEAVAMAEQYSLQEDKHFMPSVVAEYAFDLAQKFSTFYQACRVVGSPEEESRVAICNITALVLMYCLYLLGIEVPEEM